MSFRRTPLKTQKAVIGLLADTERSSNRLSHVSQDVIQRVQKCYARATHQNANEAESRAAMKMVLKIMEQHNIAEADLMQDEDKETRGKRGGMSTVIIGSATSQSGTLARAIMQGWVSWLADAMEKFFDCKAFSTQTPWKIEWTFYGIAIHTVSAAIAFEAIHNQIQI